VCIDIAAEDDAAATVLDPVDNGRGIAMVSGDGSHRQRATVEEGAGLPPRGAGDRKVAHIKAHRRREILEVGEGTVRAE